MSAERTLARIQAFLMAFSSFILAGSLLELSFSQHTKEPVQLIPFFLAGIGLAANLVVWLHPKRWSLQVLRLVMGVVTAGSIIGVGIHIARNVAFLIEVKPNATWLQMLSGGLGGPNPLLAPGILGMAAILALTATYHPLQTTLLREKADTVASKFAN